MDERIKPAPLRVLHVITGLDYGGAEMMLYKLLGSMDRARFVNAVVSLTDKGLLAERIEALDVPVYSLDMNSAASMPRALLHLRGIIKKNGIQLVQCWMYHADLLGGLASKFAGVPVIWGIRQSNFDAATSKPATVRIMRWCSRLSHRIPERIVCCSNVACRVHRQQGYAAGKMVTIPNGFQTEIFRPDEEAREQARKMLNLPPSGAVIGIVGRFDPQKDYLTFVRAAAKLALRMPDINFILCGQGLDHDNPKLMTWIREEEIDNRCRLLGRRDDLSRLYCAMDIMVSASAYGEGFPNVIGEAMACAVPCVVTDVGDSAFIVGDSGRVVPPRNPEALSDALYELLSLSFEERRRLGIIARKRIEDNYALPNIVTKYQDLYQEVVEQCAV